MTTLLSALKSAWATASQDNVDLLAAGIAYYAFLSLVPLLAASVLTYGLMADPRTIAELGRELAETLPSSASGLIVEQLESIAENRGGQTGLGLAIAVALALFGGRVAAGAVIKALNTAFGATSTRSFVRANLLALAITVGAVVAFGIVGASTALASILFAGSGGGFASFLIVGAVGWAGATLAYLTVPHTEPVPKAAAMRGALVFASGWMIASAAFGFYTANIASYDATYGSLGAIVVLLTWLFLSAYLLLFGAYVARIGAWD